MLLLNHAKLEAGLDLLRVYDGPSESHLLLRQLPSAPTSHGCGSGNGTCLESIESSTGTALVTLEHGQRLRDQEAALASRFSAIYSSVRARVPVSASLDHFESLRQNVPPRHQIHEEASPVAADAAREWKPTKPSDGFWMPGGGVDVATPIASGDSFRNVGNAFYGWDDDRQLGA